MTDPVVWMRRIGGGLVLVLGWVFILWANDFHVTAPAVFSCLGFLALVAIVLNLWRTGASVAAPEPDEDTWGLPIGARGELEKEKRSLLKAIKEAEFDREMGKLSQADADAMIRTYRARAIEVIKELERLDEGEAGSVRERIEREVQARLEVDAEAARAAGKKKDKKPGKAGKAEAKAETKPKPEPKPEAKPEPEPKPEPVAADLTAEAPAAVAVEAPGDEESKEATP